MTVLPGPRPGEAIIFDHRLDRAYVGSLTGTPSALCPDLLRYEQIGEADGLRGRVVRAFFWLMRWWPAR